MRKDLLTMAVMLLLSLLSCSGNKSNVGGAGNQALPELLATVSSDAVFVTYADGIDKALAQTKADNSLKSIDLGALSDNRCVIAWSYAGALIPVLTVDAGRTAPDSVLMASVLSSAKQNKLYVRYIADRADISKCGFFLISPSEARLNASLRHISEKQSICDLPDFVQCANLAEGADNFTLIKTSATERLLKPLFPKTDFVRNLSEWLCFVHEKNGFTIRSGSMDETGYYMNMMEKLPFSDSRLGEMLPENTSLAISLPVPPGFREKYEIFLDASSRKHNYDRLLREYKAENKTDPKRWEAENNISEAAMVRFGEDDMVVLLRSDDKNAEDIGPQTNAMSNICELLYGPLFYLKDCSCYAYSKNWHIYGTNKSVLNFVDGIRENDNESEWPGEDVRLLVYEPDSYLSWGKKGIRKWNFNH